MKKLLTAVAMLVAFALGGPAVAGHQGMQCGSYPDMASQLIERFGETPLPITFISSQEVFQFYANKETGSWTVLRIRGEIACMMASGNGLGEVIEITPVVPGDPA